MLVKQEKLWKLFTSTFTLSAFTFGGGYVIVTLMKERFVDRYHWIEEEEMLDMTAIAQSAPGPIAVNGAIVVGYKIAGLLGVFVSVIGTILPPFIILSLISFFYDAFASNIWVSTVLDGMQAGVAAVIAAVVCDMGEGVIRTHSLLDELIILAVVDLLNTLGQVFGLRRDVFSCETSCKNSDHRVGDLCRTSYGTASASDTVKGFFRTLLEVAALCVSDVLHNVQILGTCLCTCVAANAAVNLRIQIHHHSLLRFDIFNIICSLVCREERNSCHIHALFHLRLTGKACL